MARERRRTFRELVRNALALLAIESEKDLAYIYGRQPGNLDIPRQYRSGIRHSLAGRILSLLAKVLSGLGSSTRTAPADFLFFAGSDNQWKSLVPTLQALESAGARVHMLAGHGVRSHVVGDLRGWGRARPGARIVACAFGVFVLRLGVVRTELLRMPFRRYLDQFLWSYVHLPYFLDLLARMQPRTVVMSNDHGVANRSLRIAAESLGLRTVYLQHGAVSDVFPRMNYDIAFLDGMVSAEIYARCRDNPPAHGARARTRAYLSGQKKRFRRREPGDPGRPPVVGVGVNPLDHFAEVRALVESIVSRGMSCVVRCHPAQAAGFVSDLAGVLARHGALVELSDAKIHSLDAFLARCDLLVAANTSLHLEAALSGIPSFYFEFGPTAHPDYYGFVARGVVRPLPAQWPAMDLAAWRALATITGECEEAVAAFSESRGTAWEGREGTLVAKTLLALDDGSGDPGAFEEVATLPGFSHVYRLVR